MDLQTYENFTFADKVNYQVERGIKGLNEGLPMGFPEISKYICGIQQRRYDVLFAEEGCGKTAFIDNAYVLNPFKYLLENPNSPFSLEVLYFSLEVPEVDKLGKWNCWEIYQNTGKIIDTNILYSKGDYSMPPEMLKLKDEANEFLLKLEKIIQINEDGNNPTGIWKQVRDYAMERGKIAKNPKTNKEYYIPNNPNLITVIIVDTGGNLVLEKVGDLTNTKGTIDQMSKYNRIFRNKYGFTPVFVLHSNREISNVLRGRYSEIFPKKSDVKDSNVPAQDANTLMCLFDPYAHMNENNELDSFIDYDWATLKHRGKVLGILKNREGRSQLRKGLNFCGEIGAYRELLDAKTMNENKAYYYEKAYRYKQW